MNTADFDQALERLAQHTDVLAAVAEPVYRALFVTNGTFMLDERADRFRVRFFGGGLRRGPLDISTYLTLATWVTQNSPEAFQQELWNRGYLEQAMQMGIVLDWLKEHCHE